jgi:nucleoside-triphosphatase THEP1
MVEKYTIVADRLRAKYELPFYSHFANFINELLYDNIYTLHRVQTKDLLHRVSDLEHMTMYVDEENREEDESLIAFHARIWMIM